MPWWTKQEDEIIAANAEKLTARELMRLLPGRSRNSIIGRSHRTKVKLTHGRPIAIKNAASKTKGIKRGPWPKNPSIRAQDEGDPPPIKAPGNIPIRLVELNGVTCRWPYGRGPYMFCGAEHDYGPYCPFHERKAHPPAHEK